MELIEHRCKRCGGELKKIGEGRWSCPYCACVYDEAVVQKNTRTLHEEFDEVKREIVCNLRRNLYDAVNEEFISSVKVHECASELKKYLPTDFAACFYEVAVSNNVKQLTKHIRKINVEENYSEIECVVRFLIKSLQTEYLLELNNLVERAYKQRDLVLFEKYSTEISVEAEKVEGGVYETKMPRDVFVAYSSKDMEVVSELCEVLEGQGLKCFVAARNLRHGKGSVENYDKLLCEAMDHCKSFVFVSSTNSRSFSCDALTKELPYIQERDIENAPAEHKNNYANMPHSYKKPRVEYRIEESRGFSAPDSISNEFFDGYERVYSPEAVAERVAKQILLAAEKKAVKKPNPEPAPAPVVVQSAPAEVGGQRIEPLLKRAAIFIDDGEWEDAEAYCEKALDIDPECAQAYIYKLMIDLRVKKQEELADCKESFEENGNFKKAVRFGDAATGELLNGYISAINERNETERKDEIYNRACKLMKSNTVDGYEEAISKFGEIPSWRDSQKKIEECRDSIKLLKEKAEIARKEDIYKRACDLMEKNDIKSVNEALKLFSGIQKFKDVSNQITICQSKIAEINKRIEEERKRKIERMVAEEKARARKKKFLTILIIGIIAFILVCIFVIYPLVSYGSGNYAVYINMYGITDFTVPDGVTTIKSDEFNGCETLKRVTIPDSVTSIGSSAFSGCSSLSSVIIPDSVTSIGELAFYNCISLTSIEIPDSATSIGYSAFKGCSSLTSVTIPDSVTRIGDDTFYGCSSLTSIEIPDSVTSIGDEAFYNCISLTSVVIGDSVTSIDDYAFRGCSSLTSVTIGDSVTSIGSSAFEGCSSLTSVYITDIVAWRNISFGDAAANPLSCAKKLYLDGELLTELVIPDGVTSIGEYAFYNCSSLTRIEIPDSVTSIGYNAFYNCISLKSATIPTFAIRHIPKGNLETVVITSGYSIGSNAFEDCSSLTSIEIPDSVTSIGYAAFDGCSSLTSVEIGDSVTSIGSRAFYSCSSLKTVYYTGSEEQWSEISISSGNSPLTNATIIYNYVPEE